ncbi:MAG: S16 family serine protease [Ignavibacteriales bacterium]
MRKKTELTDEEIEKKFNKLFIRVDSSEESDQTGEDSKPRYVIEEDDDLPDKEDGGQGSSGQGNFPEAVRKAIEEANSEYVDLTGTERVKVGRYLEWLDNIPWVPDLVPKIDLDYAKKTLDKDQYGLEEVKERILEFLAVQELTRGAFGSVLLLVGPPGVGKTSIAKSIANAMQRQFTKVSLGGVNDETIIRGCDRTYTSAQPGNIVRALRQTGSLSCVMLLDEIDKIGRPGNQGDVTAALLEMLDSDRSTFKDHYLDVTIDLSNVLFIATANNQDAVSPILLDRMQVIELTGYSLDEKINIVREFILPQETKRHGLPEDFIKVEDEAMAEIIQEYASEPGVRTVQHHIQSICGRVAYMLVSDKLKDGITITRTMVASFLGRARKEPLPVSSKPEVGVANALGCTSSGAGVVTPVEVGVLPGNGDVQYTGNLRKVLRESCEVAISVIRARAKEWNIDPDFNDETDIHFHVLQAGVPKDGPSMGVTLLTALFSALTGIPVRHDVAMTGEITLRGKIMPIGGLEDKLAAAHYTGIKNVIIPEANKYDLYDISDKLLQQLNIIPVADVDQLLAAVLVRS